MSDIQYPIHGSCQCGSVTYELLAPPLRVVACHCKACQKLSTSAFSITALVNAEDVVFHGEMKPWQRTADSGNINAAMFCPHCGNRIYHFNPAHPEKIKLKPSNLDDTRIIQPTTHGWVSEKQDWFQIPEGATQFPYQVEY
ncbi:GFA family protein [Shewanella dokdonensis]|uniref:GFA family protein n=1 Tax=Shewanella dokdonensis TaxID=712036 RepID=A0ABX8DDM4_9GAMM|nr:GFA family protein [Shewanella dokdonensis]MCL1073329.1 GFA family protein [Shewanella dokdonensis]QVK22844.1 GFA family protein [Shewanella dokdonensis]